MTDKLVVDTCVFIKGFFNVKSDCGELLSMLKKVDARLVFSQDTLGEWLYILKRTCHKSGISDGQMKEVMQEAMNIFRMGKSTNTRHINQDEIAFVNDPDDQMFVNTAYAAKADYVITLDKKSGILSLKNVPFKCCTPKQYLQEMKALR